VAPRLDDHGAGAPQACVPAVLAGLELDLARLRGQALLAEALRMTGSAVARIPVVAVLRIGALAQGPPPVAVNLLATRSPGPE